MMSDKIWKQLNRDLICLETLNHSNMQTLADVVSAVYCCGVLADSMYQNKNNTTIWHKLRNEKYEQM